MPLVTPRRYDFRQGLAGRKRSILGGMSQRSAQPPLPGWSLSQIAGFCTWVAVGVPQLLARLQGPVEGVFGPWLACYLAFGVLFVLIGAPRFDRYLRHETLLPLIFATALTFGVIGFGGAYWVGGVLLIITASYVPHLLSPKGAALWVLGQTAFMGVMFVMTGDLVNALVQTALYLGFQVFALLTTQAALSEAAAKERLAQVNAELRATQELLSESSRMNERVRIARELHDVIGHNLTALSLNLEVASHVAEGKALTHVKTSQDLAKTLLTEVRGVVSSMREPLALDIAGALKLLAKDIPAPVIHVQVAPELCLDDPQRAQVLLRCAQEIITNTVKHAYATNLWLGVERSERGVTLSARDDGRGAILFQGGNGLTGMRERLEALGGRLELHPNPGRGFALTAVVPT